MKKIIVKSAFTCMFLLASITGFATDYYIDSAAGVDSNNGNTTSTPWKNISKLNSITVPAGSKIYLKCGSVWNGQQLKFLGSGNASSPIVIDRYGTGDKPRINGDGFSIADQGVVYLYNQDYIEINNLEITNYPVLNSSINPDSIFFVGLYELGTNPNGADRRGVMVALKDKGVSNHIYLKNLNIHHIKGQLGSGSVALNGAIPKRTGGIYFTVLDEAAASNSRFNDVLIDGCAINYCENTGLAFDNEDNVYYPGGTELALWTARRFTNIKVSNNVIHHIGKNAMIIRCTDETGLIERNVCYETAVGTTGNTMFTARAKGTVFQYNEGYFNRGTTQNIDPNNFDGSMYDADYGSINIIFQYSYSHDNSEGLFWGCNTRSLTANTLGIPDPEDKGVTVRYNISQNDKGDVFYFNYPSAGNEIYNNVIYIKSGLSPNIIHESSKQHTYTFYNNIIYNLSTSAKYAFAASNQTRTISNNIFYGYHPTGSTTGEPADAAKLITDPLFASPGSGSIGINTAKGYLLKFGSPAIASGRSIITKILDFNNDYFGNTVNSNTTSLNRGAYEGTGIVKPTISYSTSDYIFTQGVTIVPIGPQITGDEASSFTINPALPLGLNLNTSTGIISGKSTNASVQTSYTVTATNAAGSTSAIIKITIAPDSDGDGVRNEIDLCPNSVSGVTVDFNGCELFILPQDNFAVQAIATSCVGQRNGAISVSAKSTNYIYVVTVNGLAGFELNTANGFKSQIQNLAPGNYEICISIQGKPNYSQCYTVKVTEPNVLAVTNKISSSGKQVSYSVSGADSYEVDFNGTKQTYNSNNITLDLIPGQNTIHIATNLYCQGSYSDSIFVSEKVVLYPNPATDYVLIYLGGNDNAINVTLSTLSGQIIADFSKEISELRLLQIDVTPFPSGMYLVHLKGKTINETIKIIKK